MRKTRTAHMAQEATYANPESMQSQCELCWTNAEHMRNLLSEALCLCCLPIRILQDTTGSSSSSGYFWNQHLWFLQIEQLINFCRILLESASVVLANWTTYQLLYHKQKNDLAILQIIYQSHSVPAQLPCSQTDTKKPEPSVLKLMLLLWMFAVADPREQKRKLKFTPCSASDVYMLDHAWIPNKTPEMVELDGFSRSLQNVYHS